MLKTTLIAGATALALVSSVSTMAIAQDTTDASAQPIEYIAQQKSGEWLTSTMIGAAVQNQSGEELGDVNDLIIGQNGDITGAVIGVGGFLGMGEKNIAVPYSSISATSEDNETVILVNATKEELQAAPDFSNEEGKPLSVSKRWADEASKTYQKAKEQASETYEKAKEQATETYNEAKKSVSGDGEGESTSQ